MPENRYDGTRIPVMRIDGVSVTRQLPPSVSATNASTARSSQQTMPTLARPVIEVPAAELDYPQIEVPTQDEFNAAAGTPSGGGDSKAKDSNTDNNPARELTNKLPPPAVPVQPPPTVTQAGEAEQTRAGLTASDQPTTAAPSPTPAQQTAATTNGSVTLPFIGTVPLPSKESVAVASTTAVTATFVAVLGKAAIEASLEGLKPMLRLIAIRYKKMRKKELTVEDLQLEFAFIKKKKGKRSLGEMLRDFKEYMSENFFDDLIG